MTRKLLLSLIIIGLSIVAWTSTASACGGFFCQNTPVDQVGERIVFTANPDGTITALIEILYQGEADDFSWILPIPEAIDTNGVQVPDDGDLIFDQLHAQTDVIINAPVPPPCATEIAVDTAMEADAMEDDDGGVEVFSQGEVGPFTFEVVGSQDPDSLVDWLRENDYEVAPDAEPLIDIYVEREMAFVAMRLLDGETADSIQPVELTYPGTEPMIPLQLTAVAAQPEMPIWVWIFGESQAVPQNFEHMEIATEELSFFGRGANDYTFLVQRRADALGGRAFITEYAQPADAPTFIHPWLRAQVENADYLTRLHTYIDPGEMTADPTFGFEAGLADVSRLRSARELNGLYSCERDGSGIVGTETEVRSDAIDPRDGGPTVVAFTPEVVAAPAVVSATDVTQIFILVGLAVIAGGFAVYWVRQRKQ